MDQPAANDFAERHAMKQESIHPRAYYPREESRVKNTMKRKNPDVTKRKIAAMEAHLEKHPNDTATKNHISKLQST